MRSAAGWLGRRWGQVLCFGAGTWLVVSRVNINAAALLAVDTGAGLTIDQDYYGHIGQALWFLGLGLRAIAIYRERA